MPLSPIMVELRADIREFRAKMGEAQGEVEAMSKKSATNMEKFQTFGKAAAAGVALAVVGIGYESIKMAGNFQQATSVLQTAAGETSAGLKIVRAGILNIARETGTTTDMLAEGMYQVEKAGYKGAAGLQILRAAAKGAKEENANLGTVTSAMTSIMASYNIPVDRSVQVMNALKTAAAGSKTTMQEYASSLSTVLPIASAAKISFEQIAGSLAALTRHGVTADHATQELNFTIRNLLAPNMVAANTMAQFGINAADVSQKLGQRGLTGTLTYLTEVIASHVKGGLVQIDMMKKNAAAGDDMKRMLQQMSPAARQLSDDLLNNTITTASYRREVKLLDPHQSAMGTQFARLAVLSKGFSDQMRQGQPAQATMESQLKRMTGGAVGLQTALMLMGKSGEYSAAVTKAVGKSIRDSAGEVEGWKQTQGLFNTQMDRFKQIVETAAIALGTKLIPIIQDVITWMTKHKTLVEALVIVIGGALVGAIAAFVAGFVIANAAALAIGAVITSVIAIFVNWYNTSRTGRAVITETFAVITTVVSKFVDGYLLYMSTLLRAAAWAAEALGMKDLAKQLRGAAGAVDDFRKSVVTSLDGAAKAALEKAAVLAVNVQQPLADRLSQYVALANKYGRTLPEVLKDAGRPAADAAAIMALSAASGVQSAQDRMSKVSDAIASAPQFAIRNQYSRTTAIAYQLGGDISAGMAQGIANSQAAVFAAAAGLGHGAVMAAKDGAISKSPSRHTFETGQMISLGMLLGIRDGHRAAVDAAKRLGAATVKAARTASLEMKWAAEDVLRYASQMARSSITSIGGALATMLTNIAALRAQRDALSGTISSGVTSGLGNSVGIFTSSTSTNPMQDVMFSLRAQLQNARAFDDQLKALQKSGASQALITQIAGQGADVGGAFALSLLKQGPAGVKAVSSLMAQIADAGRVAGDSVSKQYYQTGIDHMVNLTKGLQSKEVMLRQQVRTISDIMRELMRGQDTGSQALGALRAVDPRGQLTGGPVMVQSNVYLDGRQIYSAMQTQSRQYAARNGRTGL